MRSTDIAIDMGSSNIRVFAKGKGVIISEPSIVAYDKETDRILALGRRAFRKPYMSICVPSGVTEVQRRAVVEAAYQSGARDVTMVDAIVAAAIGAGIDITKPVGNMIMDIGGGTCDIAVLSIGSPVISTSSKNAGNQFNEMITRYIRRNHSLFIDEDKAEEVKRRIGSAFRRPAAESMQVTGRNVHTGLKKTVSLTTEEMREALRECTSQIADEVQGVLERTPPELAADIAVRGIVMTGGGSLLHGLPELIEDRTNINVMVAEDPASCVAAGAGLYTQMMDQIGRMEY